jgi:hypothetical protein
MYTPVNKCKNDKIKKDTLERYKELIILVSPKGMAPWEGGYLLYIVLYLFKICKFFFLAVLGFELRASSLIGRHSTT